VSAFSPLACVVESLNLSADRRGVLRKIADSAWPGLLHLTDEARLTLPLAIRCADVLPASVRARVEANLESNLRRHERAAAEWREIGRALHEGGIEFLMLKGLTHWPMYVAEAWHRPQYDFDIYCPGDSAAKAFKAICGLGYEAHKPAKGPETDHLPALIRRTGFEWRGDYFDAALPMTVEIHHRFWNAARESFSVRNDGAFWSRRTVRRVGDLEVPALHPVDCLSYATWHAVRHLVQGNLRLFHVYEVACFLNETRGDDHFWKEWERAYSGERGVAEAIAFRLAVEWFGCQVHPIAGRCIGSAPVAADRWFRLFRESPILAQEYTNKDELFLHLSLVDSRRDKLRIAAQRIFPRNPPSVVLDAHSTEKGRGVTVRRAAFQSGFLVKRAVRHIGALWPVARSAVRWWREG